jgi:hypothetical protein
MKKHFIISIILLVVMIVPSLLMAQPGAPPDDPNDVLVPMDGGLSILLGAAAVYGSHKIKAHRKGKG